MRIFIYIFLIWGYTSTVCFGFDSSTIDARLDKLTQYIESKPISERKRMVDYILYRINTIDKNSQSEDIQERIEYVQDFFTPNKYDISQKGDHTDISSHNSLILRFTHGGDITKTLSDNSKRIQTSQSVFVFRTNDNLSLHEIQTITRELKKLNPDILIFIDQEGGNVNRYVDFPSTQELPVFLESSFVTSRMQQMTLEERDFVTSLFSVQKLYYYPSLSQLSQTYDRFQNDSHAQMFLEIAAYIRLASLKSAGINTYGIVLDLNRGNPAISQYGRSFSTHSDTYNRLVEAFSTVSEEVGVMLYAKHFPGHGKGYIDSHKAILDMSKDTSYITENTQVFSHFLELPHRLPRGVMTGHMSLSHMFLHDFKTTLETSDFILTDDLAMQGYKKATGTSNQTTFFTTDNLPEKIPIITVNTGGVARIE